MPLVDRRLAPRTGSVATLVVLVVAACGSTAAPSGSPPAASAASASPAPATAAASATPFVPTPVPGSVGPASPVPTVSQTETDWGRIWDAIPAGFPRYPGSVPTETGSGPASAEFAVPTDPKTAATELQSALEAATYSTQAQSGPLEDGSIVIDSIGEDPACRVETRLSPLGGTTLMTVLYGACCPTP
jgi:hypothetical protein